MSSEQFQTRDILEVETFIPMLLQSQSKELGSRLKRVVLIGDHHQLPPVVKNMAFQKYSKLDQSMFTRFVRLGMPAITLNMQGRSRPGIAALYSWRYKHLGNLPAVCQKTEYNLANAGFACEFQLINVEDYEGRGETTPQPYFYQNLGEAEYAVQLYMYMRLLGYPAEKISILTTYNGQKQLIRDVVRQRCELNPLFGEPAKITTVDKYQGQQNDYVILSLVRTVSVGHLRDVRRLVVALSRARLGLYVLCRQQLFEQCYELTPSFNQLLARPSKLHIVPNEMFPAKRRMGAPSQAVVVDDLVHMGSIVSQMTDIATNKYKKDYDNQMIEWQDAFNKYHQDLKKQADEAAALEGEAGPAEPSRPADSDIDSDEDDRQFEATGTTTVEGSDMGDQAQKKRKLNDNQDSSD